MPYKPKSPCKYQGCPNLCHGSFCDEHKQVENRRYNKYQRDPTINKRYDSKWRRIRDRYISANPLCELCRENGRLIAADTVHHRLPLSDGGTHDWNNLQSLCHSCHSRIHMTENNQTKSNANQRQG